MLTVSSIVVALLGVPVAAAALYLMTLTLLWKREVAPAGPGRRRFLVLVPAHNEALGIGATLRSLQAIEYPADRYRIVVVADNCTDDTAAIARARGAEVMIRQDRDHRGKGQALQWAFDRLLSDASAWDAAVVVDADSRVEPNLLRVIEGHLNRGADAVQAAYLPWSRSGSGTAVLTDIAFTAFHLVRSGARERLRLSCGLRGNGMAFTRRVLRLVPHTAASKTEDVEFGVLLGLQGFRVAFAAGTTVRGDMPDDAASVDSQRERWIGGRLALARRQAGPLLWQGIGRRSGMLIDLALDLLVPPVSVLAGVIAVGSVMATGLWGVGGPGLVAAVWGTALVGLTVHVFHAAALAGRSRALLSAAVTLPGYALRKARILARTWRSRDDRWVRTTRQGELS
jgi:cellulose synthase/poly-beta-1,6-N-acetylglucosamine synthase-like glycosyltransferase